MIGFARLMLIVVAIAITAVAGLTAMSVPGCGSKSRTETTKGGGHAANSGKARGGNASHQTESGAPARPALDAEAGGSCTSSQATRGDERRKRPVLGNARIHLPENAGVTRPKPPDDLGRSPRATSQARTGESRRRDFAGGRETSCTLVDARASHLRSGPTGFDTERESEAIVQAVSARFEQLANPSCKRQRSFRSSRGLNGVDEQGARVAHRRKHTSSAATRLRVAAQIQKMVEAPTPLVPEAVRCLKSDYARERTSEANFVDLGSTPSGSTHRNQSVSSTQQQESATRLASVALSVTGSAAAQPDSHPGAA